MSLRKIYIDHPRRIVDLVGVPALNHLTDWLLSFLFAQLSQHVPIIMSKIKTKQGKH